MPAYNEQDFMADVLAHFRDRSLIVPNGVYEMSPNLAYDAIIDGLDKLLTERDRLQAALGCALGEILDLSPEHDAVDFRDFVAEHDNMMEREELMRLAVLGYRRLENHYRHCGVEWTQEWSCACNDDCPECGAEIEPYESKEIT